MAVDNQIPRLNDLSQASMDGLALVNSHRIKNALASSYRSSAGHYARESGQRVIDQLTSRRLPPQALCRFLAGWREMHGTALFVSGLIIRLQRLAAAAEGEAQLFFYRAAGEIGEIVAEDTGLDDVPHLDRFHRFANFIATNDDWQLDRYRSAACVRFRSYLSECRLRKSLEEAILTTAASESWNTGEYTYFGALLNTWATETLGRSSDTVTEDLAYVTVHAGETELGHFLHALRAWDNYCGGVGIVPDEAYAQQVFENYFYEVGQAFEGIEAEMALYLQGGKPRGH